MVLGHPPRYWIDDPSEICQGDALYRTLGFVSGISAFILPGNLVSWPIAFAMARSEMNPRARWLSWIAFALGWLLIACICRYDPGGYIKWIID
jgi:hypothetical protein